MTAALAIAPGTDDRVRWAIEGERRLIGMLLADPSLYRELPEMDPGLLMGFQSRAALSAIAEVIERSGTYTREDVRRALMLRRGHHHPEDVAWFDEIEDVALADQPVQRLRAQALLVTRIATELREAGERDERESHEIDDQASRDVEHAPTAPTPTAPKWRRCRDDIDTIQARSTEPWIRLQLDGVELVTLRAGAILVLVGPTGRGKTSLALSLLVEHASSQGPAIAMSLELPADELTARAIGMRRDASWRDVLTGQVDTGAMLSALPERLARIDRDDATLANLAAAIADLRALYPGEPILVAVDYVQLVGADSGDDIRPRIGRVMRDIDKLARSSRVVVLALSQGSRASSRALSSGERIGADTVDAGAESAALEQWSTATLAIGAAGEASDDGSCAVELSLGKSRMGGGDRVLPARMNGRTGWWWLAGESRPASEVRAERTAQRDASKVAAAAHAVAGALSGAPGPMSMRALLGAIGGARSVVYAACRAVLADGRAVRVRGKKAGGAWPMWTRDRATEAGIDIVPEGADAD